MKKFTCDAILQLLMLITICSQIGRVFSRSLKLGQASMPQKRSLSFSLDSSEKRVAKMFVTDAEEKIEASQVHTVQYLDTPDKSEFDKKSYRTIVLPNGFKALLISDPSKRIVKDHPPEEGEEEEEDVEEMDLETSETGFNKKDKSVDDSSSSESSSLVSLPATNDHGGIHEKGGEKLAACALSIGVGSYSDPKNIQGLAHFLEHMIFMGSDKYPTENEYDAYIQKCGGFDNAATDVEETTFYFEIDEEYLGGALDRFSNLFIHPLMFRDSMFRERDAVESEFQTNINSDLARRDQLFALMGQETHPSSLFTWGNLKTLKANVSDDELYEAVHEFRRRHYSAHRMTFSIQARMPLDELQDLTVKHFVNVPNNNLPADDFSIFTHANAFKSEFYEKMYFVKPKANICRLDVTWCLPSVLKKYKCKALDYLSYIIGYEGKGSLISYLKKRMWALEIHTGANYGAEKNTMFTLFSVSINVTDLGYDYVNEILQAIFSYIRLLKHHGPNRKLFDELKLIEDNSFRFKKEKDAVDNVEEHVVNMRYYPAKDILTGSELYFEYNKEEIQQAIDWLNTDKFNVMIAAKKPYKNVVYNKTEPWFGTEYGVLDFAEEGKKMWSEAVINDEMHLPFENPYISTNFDIYYLNGHNNNISLYPVKIFENSTVELWYKQDDHFLLPTAIMNFYFITPLTMLDPFNATLQTLFTLILKFQIAEDLYPAEVAGLDYEIFSSEKGIVMKIEGYNEKLYIIADEVTKQMKRFEQNVNEEVFDAIKKKLAKSYYNEIIIPSKLAKNTRLKIVQNVHWSTIERFSILKRITLKDLQQYSSILFKEMRVQSLIQGNILQEDAVKIMEMVLGNLECGPIRNLSSIESRAKQFPNGETFLCMKSFRPDDVNSVVTNFYQAGPMTPQMTAEFELLVMLMEEPLFDMLRTKEQLGYDLSAVFRDNFGILGFSISVHSQETKFKHDHIERRIECFTKNFTGILEQMTEEHFTVVQNSLMKRKQILDTELKNEVSRNWAEITTEEYIFDRQKKELEYIKELTQTKMVEFYKNLMEQPEVRRKFSIQVIGSNESSVGQKMATDDHEDLERTFELEFVKTDEELQESNNRTYITDIEAFKKSLYTYPVTKSQFV